MYFHSFLLSGAIQNKAGINIICYIFLRLLLPEAMTRRAPPDKTLSELGLRGLGGGGRLNSRMDMGDH